MISPNSRGPNVDSEGSLTKKSPAIPTCGGLWFQERVQLGKVRFLTNQPVPVPRETTHGALGTSPASNFIPRFLPSKIRLQDSTDHNKGVRTIKWLPNQNNLKCQRVQVNDLEKRDVVNAFSPTVFWLSTKYQRGLQFFLGLKDFC